MLYDPKWEQQTETAPDLHALSTLIAWLEKQPPDQVYSYTKPDNCLLAQYLKAHGKTEFDDYCLSAIDANTFFDAPKKWNGVCPILVSGRWTFGAALGRARAALAHS